MQSPSIPKGTRDFLPVQMIRRKHIFKTIEAVYLKYGFMPIETPAMENIATLTGKYGDEGDKLLFRILDSGDFLADTEERDKAAAQTLLPKISGKGLRYDLTVPLARFVVQNRNDIQFPFRRYQMQPVWRADRPQKGRYREFWQCDADIIGSGSLTGEADLIAIYNEVFTGLELTNYELRVNHRKLLEAVAQTIGYADKFRELTIAIDKFDKIGFDGVVSELMKQGFDGGVADKLRPFMEKQIFNYDTLDIWEKLLLHSDAATAAFSDLRELLDCLQAINHPATLYLDGTLARGLDYYTGCIFEAAIPGSGIGSVSGGGRYDDLTGVFGLNDMPGVGISFGIDRIYDIMEENNLFGNISVNPSKVLFCHFDRAGVIYSLKMAAALRSNGIACEVYPDQKKIGKQFDYANKRGFQFVAVAGEQEIKGNVVALKDMISGEQTPVAVDELIKRLS